MILNSRSGLWIIKTACASLFLVFFLIISHAKAENIESDIQDLWQIQKRVLSDPRADALAIESAKKSLIEYLLDHGILRSNVLASAYSIEGFKADRDEKLDLGLWAYRTALQMDPGYLPAARGLFRVSFNKGFAELLSNLPEIVRVYTRAFSDVWFTCLMLGNLSVFLGKTILLYFFIIVASQTIRKFPLWVHLIQERFPSNINNKFALIGLCVFLVSPVFMGMGLIWMSIFWAILVYVFSDKKESRAIWLVILAFILIIPINIFRVSILKGYNEIFLQAMAYTRLGGYSQGAIDSLKLYQTQNPEDSKSRFLAGVLYKRGGKYFEALKEFLDYSRMAPDDSYGHINLGNIYFILNNLTEAIAEYRKAETLDPQDAMIYYNLSKAYLHQFKFQQASDMLKRASQLDSQLVDYYTEIHSSNPNRILADASLPASWIWDEIRSLGAYALPEQEKYWSKLGPGLDLSGTAVVIAVLILILSIIHIFKSKLDLGHFCEMCGEPGCRNCRIDSSVKEYCRKCQHLFLRKGQIELHEREIMMTELNDRQAKKWKKCLLMNSVFPGTGDLLYSSSCINLVIAFLWSLFIVLLIPGEQVFILVWNTPNIFPFLEYLLIFSLMGILYVATLVRTLRRKTD